MERRCGQSREVRNRSFHFAIESTFEARFVHREGVVLAGVSAGAICWFEQCLTDSYAGSLTVLDCLGFLPGSCCPHYDGEPERRPLFHELISKGEILPGFGLEDSAAIHFINQDIYRIIASDPYAKAYQMAESWKARKSLIGVWSK